MSELPFPPDAVTTSPKRVPLWRSGVHALGTSIIAIFLAVTVNILLARALGPQGKGSYELALASTALLIIMLGFSLPVGITYVVARGRANVRTLTWQLAGVALLFGALALAVLQVLHLTPLSPSFIPPEMESGIVILMALTACATEAVNYWRAILNGRQEIIRANRGDLLSRAVHVVILLLAVGWLMLNRRQASPTLFIAINLAVLVLTNLIFLKILSPALRASTGPSGLAEVIAYAFPCYLGNFVQFLNYRLDVFLVNYFSGRDAVGLYTLAVALGQMIWLVSRAAATVLLPNVAALQEAATANANRTAQISRIAFGLSLISALGLTLFATPLVPLIFGAAFRPSVTPLLWLLPGIVAFSVANVIASYFAGIGKPRLNLYVALAGLAVTIVFDLLLIPTLGTAGAAIASTLSYSVSTAVIVWLFVRQSGVPVQQVLVPTREDLALGISLLRSLLQQKKLERR